MNALSDILSNNDDIFPQQSDVTEQSSVNNDIELETNKDNFNNGTMEQSDNEKSEANLESTHHSPSNPDLQQLKTIIYSMQDQLSSMLRMINGEEIKKHDLATEGNSELMPTGEQIVEGVFNGEKMIGPDGKEYSIPPNYASKSKLVEGDMMKLTITNRGQFIYKSIAPIERKRLKGELVHDPVTGQWSILADGKTYKTLTASVTYFRGKAGDEVVFFVPETGNSEWGAVENIVGK